MFYIISVFCVLLAFIVCWFCMSSEGNGIFGGMFFGGLLGFLAYMIMVMLPTEIIANVTTDHKDVEYPVYSMGDSLGTKGEFHVSIFGGWGYVESSPAFMYYVKDSSGAFRLKHIEANLVKIIETDDVNPHYARSCQNFESIPLWLRSPWSFGNFQYDKLDCKPDYTFYVPKGSITPTFTLDAS